MMYHFGLQVCVPISNDRFVCCSTKPGNMTGETLVDTPDPLLGKRKN